MANKLKSMLQVRRILKLLSDGHSKREVSRKIGAIRNTIDSYEARFHLSGKSYDDLVLAKQCKYENASPWSI
jgi:uncharacterized protein YerC